MALVTENTAAEIACATAQDLDPIREALCDKGRPFGLENTGGYVMALLAYVSGSCVAAITNDGVIAAAVMSAGDWYLGTDEDGEPLCAEFSSPEDLLRWLDTDAKRYAERMGV